MSKKNSRPTTEASELSSLSRWQGKFSYMEGQLLTIVDASINDNVQRDAMKSLMRIVLWDSRRTLEMSVKDEPIVTAGLVK